VAVAGALATYTRNAGILVVVSGALLAWERRAAAPPGWKAYAAAAAGLAGFAAFLIEQKLAFDNMFEWVDAQQRWGRRLVFPWETLRDDWLGLPGLDPRRRDVDRMYRTQELLALGALLPLLFLRRRLGLPWAIWALGAAQWLLPLCSHSLISSARYQASNVYFALAIPILLVRYPLLRGLLWWAFGITLAWYASTYPFGVWAT
jgi:hypothetical protein